MSANVNVLDNIRCDRFASEVNAIMKKRQPRQHALMLHFARESESFATLRDGMVDRYFSEQRQLSPLFCVDAITQMVDSMIANMQQNLQQAA